MFFFCGVFFLLVYWNERDSSKVCRYMSVFSIVFKTELVFKL